MEGAPLEPGIVVEHRYVVRRFIAAGGTAELYAATHRVTGREVALKMPRRDRERDPAVHERLLREGDALARARHPGVVDILDAGRHGPAPYLVLELIEGRTLGGLLAARAKLGWEDVSLIGARTAQIVGHCHARGVVHRDLKPDNLFATPAGSGGVKLFDFGIARMLDAPHTAPAQKLTQEGAIVGTPEYMAPEALELHGEQDHRVDVYSLGVVLFELLTGAVPFEGRYAEVLVQVSTKSLPSLAALRPDVPKELVSIVERCLARDPANRFQSMEEVREGLVELVGAPDVGPPPTADADGSNKHTLADTPVARSMPAGAAAGVTPATGKRRFPRAPYTTPAQLTLATGETIAGQVEEISEGGVQFIAARGIAAGDGGEFRFAEPITGRICRTTAVSRWTKTGRAG